MTALPRPMLAVPTDALPDDAEQWAYEMKWDGYRAIVEVAGRRLRIASRRGLDMTDDYPELAGLVGAPNVDDLVVDGELVVLDDHGRPSFAAIQKHRSSAVLMCFDVLRLEGDDITGFPWQERRQLLEALKIAGPCWQTPPISAGSAADAIAAATALGLEGVVAKRRDAPYRPGARLRYAGRVGSGLDDAARDALAAGLVRRATSPFVDPPRVPGAVWVEPDIVAEVKFTEWTDDDVLRQPVFLGLRVDKAPTDVVRET
ncbi:MAG TPA: hypothetical protein VMX12_01875 [Acidimicrobiia bacterium]|nr:hypothetical protein [Acidimicrobiia bacterium]